MRRLRGRLVRVIKQPSHQAEYNCRDGMVSAMPSLISSKPEDSAHLLLNQPFYFQFIRHTAKFRYPAKVSHSRYGTISHPAARLRFAKDSTVKKASSQ